MFIYDINMGIFFVFRTNIDVSTQASKTDMMVFSAAGPAAVVDIVNPLH